MSAVDSSTPTQRQRFFWMGTALRGRLRRPKSFDGKTATAAGGWALVRWIDAGLHVLFLMLVVVVLLRSQGCDGLHANRGLWTHPGPASQLKMNRSLNRVIYKGLRTSDRWEFAAARPGQSLR